MRKTIFQCDFNNKGVESNQNITLESLIQTFKILGDEM